MPETRSMAREQKLQRLMIEVKDFEAQVDRLVEERNNLQCEMRMLKSSKETIHLKLTNTLCLLEESKEDNDHKQAVIDTLRVENCKLQATSDRVGFLEEQLREAHSSLISLQKEKCNTEKIQSFSLHNELSFALHEELSFTNVTSDHQFAQWTDPTTENLQNHERPRRPQQVWGGMGSTS
ncbi:hypothetical protein O0L34_g17671 [Tuta absoluta]|nr:hypothetical protein O0L34_g17671 [Tuta absoluta]